MTTLDGRKLRGDSSRRAIMRVAVDLASVNGLEGLSIGALASETAMSKGGVVALFGTKEQLQLATIAAASEIFVANVITPALEVRGGLERLEVLLDSWLRYSESRVFRGGCFFAAATAELGSREGPLRDAVAQLMRDWHDFVRRTIERAVANGDLPEGTDAAQLTFEFTSLLDGANDQSLLFGSSEPYDRARSVLARVLG
ncbi:MAG: TetR/AcrR family transcriptional regulator [Salinibacterium sp.]|nr:TetR/AcrR family transcriptional regulator [Salinibacterium sp.]